MSYPIVSLPPRPGDTPMPLAATGGSFSIMEWTGSGPASLHIHHRDDEAWHVLEGTLRFRFSDRTVDVPEGGTVWVPAGVAHTYEAAPGSRYLIVLTPRVAALIRELQRTTDDAVLPAVYLRYESEMLEPTLARRV
ncbi:MAG TPA: cupin domain-containing protein [Gemmatimonadales bacterium]|nr:cupin domain-containing protein [Gemmatimonadales bacterium]